MPFGQHLIAADLDIGILYVVAVTSLIKCMHDGARGLRTEIDLAGPPFRAIGDGGDVYEADTLVIATGGLSIPTMGATGFGYQVAKQFGHHLLPTRAGLVPFTITDQLKDLCNELSGTSVDCLVSCNGKSFRENLLFTHRGLSGPAILRLSA